MGDAWPAELSEEHFDLIHWASDYAAPTPSFPVTPQAQRDQARQARAAQHESQRAAVVLQCLCRSHMARAKVIALRSGSVPAEAAAVDAEAQAAHVDEAPEEAVPSVLAGVNLQRIKPPKALGTKYRCIGNAVIRKGCAMDSDKAQVDKLEAGQEIIVLERVTLDDGTVRLRFEDGAHIVSHGVSFSGIHFAALC